MATGLATAVSELAAEPLMATERLQKLGFVLPGRSFRLIERRDRRRSRAAAAFIAEL